MAKVRLAPILRPSAGNQKIVAAQGQTLAEVLTNLYSQYPALREQIQSGDELSKYVNIYINDQDVRLLQGVETTVNDIDTVTLLPAMAGGR